MGLIDTFNPKPRKARDLYEMEIVRTRKPFETRYVPDGFARRAIVMVIGVYC